MYSGVIDFLTETAGLSGSEEPSAGLSGHSCERRVNLIDQPRNLACSDRIVADISGYDFCGQLDEVSTGCAVWH